jgi:hypothetical protein
MPTEAYAHGGLCPMPSRTSYESSKGYNCIFYVIYTKNMNILIILSKVKSYF